METKALIRRIELRNFASHEETELEFATGKNVIIGATGSGKTNILQAIDFAFLGDVPEVNLTELIADNSDTAEATVEYEFPRTGQHYRIERILKRGADGKAEHECTLTNLATGEVIKKPEPVRRTLESFGVDPSVWRFVVHVTQGRFGDILEETQERKSSLDKLFRVSQLEAAYQELGRREGPAAQIELRKRVFVEKLVVLKRDASRLDEEKQNLKHLQEQRKRKQEELTSLETETRALTEHSQQITKTLEQLQTVDDAIRKAEAASENAQGQLKILLARLADEKMLPTSACTSLGELPSDKIPVQITQLQTDLERLTEEDRKLEQAHDRGVEETSRLQSNLDQTIKERNKIDQEIEQTQQYLYGKSEQPKIVCDRCGSLLTESQWTEHFQERRKQLTELDEQTKETSKRLEAERTLGQQNRKERENVSKLIKNLDHAIPIIKQIQTHRQTIETDRNTTNRRIKAELIRQLRTQLGADQSKSDLEVIQDASALTLNLKTLLARIEQLKPELSTFDQNIITPQQNRVQNAEEAADEAAKLEPKINADEQKIGVLETVRRSLREIQPLVRGNFVAKISQSANDYMKRLYRAQELENFELTEDYEFMVTRSGYKRHCRRLSGGQQVLASMAFLLALSEVLSELDFLILDEPTTHLDDGKRRELVTVLGNLRRVPQLLIVDHHPELFQAADTRFQVTLTPQGLSRVTQN